MVQSCDYFLANGKKVPIFYIIHGISALLLIASWVELTPDGILFFRFTEMGTLSDS